MSNELREALVVAIECILFSLLLIIIAFFSNYSKDALNQKTLENLSITEVQEFRNMFEFTEGKQVTKESLEVTIGKYPNIDFNALKGVCKKIDDDTGELKYSNIISGDDVLRFIGMYTQKYNVHIYKLNNIKYDYLELTTLNSTQKWDVVENKKWLGTNSVNEFYCLAIFDDLFDMYDSVIFIEKEK